MSITDTLREAFDSCTVMAGVEDDFECVYITKSAALVYLDDIDEQHEREMDEAQGATVYLPSQCVALPYDADGEPINIGDVMEWVGDKNVILTVSGVGAGVFFAWSKYVGKYTQCDANAYRHCQKPTIEDVLREFANRVYNSGHQWGLDAADTIAEYAEKLREVVEHERD